MHTRTHKCKQCSKEMMYERAQVRNSFVLLTKRSVFHLLFKRRKIVNLYEKIESFVQKKILLQFVDVQTRKKLILNVVFLQIFTRTYVHIHTYTLIITPFPVPLADIRDI